MKYSDSQLIEIHQLLVGMSENILEIKVSDQDFSKLLLELANFAKMASEYIEEVAVYRRLDPPA
ncbi:hypothetical protein ABIC11_004402 [Pseudomonas oryzihabitans]